MLLHSLVTVESLGEEASSRTLWVISLWPASFVLVMGYAESLFLVLSAATFYCWRRGSVRSFRPALQVSAVRSAFSSCCLPSTRAPLGSGGEGRVGLAPGLAVVVAKTAPNLASLERYALSCFPLAIATALLLERALVERVVLSLLAAGLAFAATLAFLALYVR